jgi:hypothetical protein
MFAGLAAFPRRQNVAAAPLQARPLNVVKPLRRKADGVFEGKRGGHINTPRSP